MRITTTAILALTTSFGFAKKQEDIVSLRHYRRQNLPSDGGRSLQEEEYPVFAKNDGIKKAKKEQQHNRYRKSQGHTAGGVGLVFTTSDDAAVLEDDGDENTDIKTNILRGVLPLTNGGEKKGNAQSLEWVSTHHDKYKITNHDYAKEEEHEEADIGILTVKSTANGSTTTYGTTTNKKGKNDEEADIGILSTTSSTNAGRGHTARILAPVTCASEGDTCDATKFTQPCQSIGSKVYVTAGSCNFNYACYAVAGGISYDPTVVITCSSCNEYAACSDVARFGDSSSTVTIENVSCNARYSCKNLGSGAKANTSFTISDSCNGGDRACKAVGIFAEEGAQFKFEGSCNAEDACYYLGSNAKTGTIFEITGGSCSGAKKTCFRLGYNAYYDVTFKISNASCNGLYSCRWMGYEVYGNSVITVDNGSCIGTSACEGALTYAYGPPVTLTIDNGSCNNERACMEIGYLAEGGTFTIDEGSCNGISACEGIGYNSKDATFTITSNSCIDQKACYQMGYTPAGAGAEFTVSDGSCTGKQACAYLGQFAAENAIFNIASTACIGYKACYYFGAFVSEVSIGEGSCNVAGACTFTKLVAPESYDPIVIGANSCTCEGCCTDLQPGSIIGDCQCNEEGDDCAGQLVNRPDAGECPTLTCASQAGAVPCGFSDDPTVQFTSFCELHDGKHFHNNCRRHQVDDEISLLGPGDAIEKDRIIASCGCCDEKALKEVAEYKNIANDIKEEDAAFCSEPICTPEDSSWEICSGGSKKASKVSKASKGKSSGQSESDIKIKFCKNGKTECRDPFHKFSSKDTVTCGSCP